MGKKIYGRRLFKFYEKVFHSKDEVFLGKNLLYFTRYTSKSFLFQENIKVYDSNVATKKSRTAASQKTLIYL